MAKKKNNEINLDNEKEVIQILSSWPNLTNIKASEFNEDINLKIDVTYMYQSNATVAQIKKYSWMKKNRKDKLEYLDHIKKTIKDNKNQEKYKDLNIENFWFIFWTIDKKKIIINKFKKIDDLINEIKKSETIESYKTHDRWPNPDIDYIKLQLAKGIIEVDEKNWSSWIPSKFVAISGIENETLRRRIDKDKEAKELWNKLKLRVDYYRTKAVIKEKHDKNGYYSDEDIEFDLNNDFKSNKELNAKDVDYSKYIVNNEKDDGWEEYDGTEIKI